MNNSMYHLLRCFYWGRVVMLSTFYCHTYERGGEKKERKKEKKRANRKKVFFYILIFLVVVPVFPKASAQSMVVPRPVTENVSCEYQHTSLLLSRTLFSPSVPLFPVPLSHPCALFPWIFTQYLRLSHNIPAHVCAKLWMTYWTGSCCASLRLLELLAGRQQAGLSLLMLCMSTITWLCLICSAMKSARWLSVDQKKKTERKIVSVNVAISVSVSHRCFYCKCISPSPVSDLSSYLSSLLSHLTFALSPPSHLLSSLICSLFYSSPLSVSLTKCAVGRVTKFIWRDNSVQIFFHKSLLLYECLWVAWNHRKGRGKSSECCYFTVHVVVYVVVSCQYRDVSRHVLSYQVVIAIHCVVTVTATYLKLLSRWKANAYVWKFHGKILPSSIHSQPKRRNIRSHG